MNNEDIVGESGGIPGLVRITCDSLGNPKKVEIDDLVFKETDKQLVSDLFVAALDDLNQKILEKGREQLSQNKSALKKLLGGSGFPVTPPPAPPSFPNRDDDLDNGDGNARG